MDPAGLRMDPGPIKSGMCHCARSVGPPTLCSQFLLWDFEGCADTVFVHWSRGGCSGGVAAEGRASRLASARLGDEVTTFGDIYRTFVVSIPILKWNEPEEKNLVSLETLMWLCCVLVGAKHPIYVYRFGSELLR